MSEDLNINRVGFEEIEEFHNLNLQDSASQDDLLLLYNVTSKTFSALGMSPSGGVTQGLPSVMGVDPSSDIELTIRNTVNANNFVGDGTGITGVGVDVVTALSSKENSLGNPTADNMYLMSDSNGDRQWITAAGYDDTAVRTLISNNRDDIDANTNNKENSLGKPTENNMILQSTSSGVRSWVVNSGGGGGQPSDDVLLTTGGEMNGPLTMLATNKLYFSHPPGHAKADTYIYANNDGSNTAMFINSPEGLEITGEVTIKNGSNAKAAVVNDVTATAKKANEIWVGKQMDYDVILGNGEISNNTIYFIV